MFECYYIKRAKVADIQNERHPNWEVLKTTYYNAIDAYADAEEMERENPDYCYEVIDPLEK